MAIAPERMGIGIRRQFTRSGQHPYDTVVWERRDARIVNLSTGEVAFEQLGVEVPSAWSFNATNILAQKYFRGTLGAPDREWSLKQVVDRVVDSITAWGVNGGYFTDDDEAATFSDELKYLIIHQKSAFNSPVWFNIGVAGVPQQSSACQPYDSHVSTPDGLVPIGRLVETDAVGTKVYDAHGVTSVVAVKANGRKPVLRLRTKAGLTLDVTGDHLVWRRTGDGTGRFVPAAELRVGDQLTWHRTESWGSGEIHARYLYEAALAGWLQSDGFVGQYEGTNRSLTIEAMTVTQAELDWVTAALDRVFPSVHRHERKVVTKDTSLDCRRTRLCGDVLAEFVDRWNLRVRGREMAVPAHLFEAPLPVVRCYLRSVFQAEGYVSQRERSAVVAFDTISEGITRGSQQLLARFGIFSRVRFKADRRVDRQGCWSLTIQNAADRRRFADEIGFVDHRKAEALERTFSVPGRSVNDVKSLELESIESIGEMDVYDIQTESGEYLSGNLRVHNCFILSVDDSMDSILNWYTEEGTIFKGGSGAGVNLSKIRSSQEGLKGGGTASGPVSFMRGADASAGTIKSGGKTRRAAKMVILNADHPDIQDFIWCKAIEERKARALRDAGFDMDLDGKDSHSIQYQNANNSVRVTDEFMQAVLHDADWHLRAITTGEVVETVRARDLFRQIAKAAWECADPGMQFDTTINRWHTAPNTDRINASNPCSEYMHIDNSACNLASLNLMTYLHDDGTFDVEGFRAATEVVFTAQEILVGNADYPTEKIAANSRRFRQLGIGYANLGALLMAQGLPYDSDAGRAWAAAITALLTGHAYATSARTAARMAPFAGFQENREAMLRVLHMHREEASRIDEELVPPELLSAAQESWDNAVEIAEQYGVRNSQASVLAPTGCLVGGSLVATDRGLVRLHSLGDPEGVKWQGLEAVVATDGGPQRATQFYVNGLESVVKVETRRGHSIQGTPQHRVKVVDRLTGEWAWKRFGDIRPGDVVPMALNQLVGTSNVVPLPPLPEAYWTGEHHAQVPRQMTADLAELVGYFMGDGSLHSRSLRFCVTAGDEDVVSRLRDLCKAVFGLEAHVTPKRGYDEVRVDSVRVVCWWEACGFAKRSTGRTGKGYTAHIPDAVLHSNDRTVYAAFLRGLYEADGDNSAGYPTLKNTSVDMVRHCQSLLLALGYPTALTLRSRTNSWGTAPLACLRLLNQSYNERWLREVGFISDRKNSGIAISNGRQAGRHDHIPLSRELIDRLAPVNDRLRKVLLMEHARGCVSRRVAAELFERTADAELGHLLTFYYDRVSDARLTGEEFTYDLSVPANVTYIANGFISHNTIGLLMDCDTTGIEPDLGLVKMKKLVGGGTMSIVNQTVPRALTRLGYSADQVNNIVAYIDEHKSILGAPDLSAEHLPVFACSMGDNAIHYRGHVRMMGAVQPFISGAISKCVTGETLVSTSDGLIRIGGLRQGEAADSFRDMVVEVASLGGPTKTDAFYYGGTRAVRDLKLRSGHRITGTPNHRVLVATDDGLDWRRLDEIEPDDCVAIQYGDDLWSALPARFDTFAPSPAYGGQKEAQVPSEMTEDLAFLLGAFASEGHMTKSGWTLTITNSVDAVLDKVAATIESLFGVRGVIRRTVDRCPSVQIHSKTIVEFFEYLGCGSDAPTKRIPDAVLRSPRPMILNFLQGLALDAYVTNRAAAKWAICLDSYGLLDDLQAVLTNLGIVHSRIAIFNSERDKFYDEVYACGRHAQRLAEMVPFLEPDKAARARQLLARSCGWQGTADLVPGISPRDLYDLLPRGRSGRSGRGNGVRSEFTFLCDSRTRRVTHETLRRVAAADAILPSWLQTVIDDNLHFSPVVCIGDIGGREVFDLSVPSTHAFVGNGIVNHNTVNMPADITIEEVEQLHVEAWQLGLKAVAIYRDNCKVAQPLATAEKTLADPSASPAEVHDAELALKVAELEKALQRQTVIVKQPIRERLPRKRRSTTFAFRVADCEGYVTVGEYDDGRPGEVFMKVSKQGSTLSGIMDAFSIAISLGLQHGVPLATYVKKYTNMRFEPAGMTDDPELRIAQSLIDYIFRRLAVDYLSYTERVELGVLTSAERTQQTLPGVEEATTPSSQVVEPMRLPLESDAPYCFQCGVQMIRSGSCHACPSCGTTSGCS